MFNLCIQEAADAKEELKRVQWEEELLHSIVAMLKTCPDQESSMNEILNQINTVSGAPTGSEDCSPSAALSHRRVRVVDLKKLLRKAGSHQFRIDDSPSRSVTHVQLLTPTNA